MSKLLRQGLLDTNAKIFFDIDGVLAPYEFGIFSHCIDDEEWDEMVKDKEPLYEGLKSVPILKAFIDRIKEGHGLDYIMKIDSIFLIQLFIIVIIQTTNTLTRKL